MPRKTTLPGVVTFRVEKPPHSLCTPNSQRPTTASPTGLSQLSQHQETDNQPPQLSQSLRKAYYRVEQFGLLIALATEMKLYKDPTKSSRLGAVVEAYNSTLGLSQRAGLTIATARSTIDEIVAEGREWQRKRLLASGREGIDLRKLQDIDDVIDYIEALDANGASKDDLHAAQKQSLRGNKTILNELFNRHKTTHTLVKHDMFTDEIMKTICGTRDDLSKDPTTSINERTLPTNWEKDIATAQSKREKSKAKEKERSRSRRETEKSNVDKQARINDEIIASTISKIDEELKVLQEGPSLVELEDAVKKNIEPLESELKRQQSEIQRQGFEIQRQQSEIQRQGFEMQNLKRQLSALQTHTTSDFSNQ